MNYFVSRAGQQYGPYSLADLQRYIAQGNVLITDLARADGTEQWIPVSQVVGNIPVSAPPPAPPAYGQVPVYPQPVAAGGPLPPGLHWALVLVLILVTCGVFAIVWQFVQALYIRKIQPEYKALYYYIGSIVAWVPVFAIIGMLSAVRGDGLNGFSPGYVLIMFGLELLPAILAIAGHFSIKGALEDHFNRVEPINLRMSGVMTFFFNTLYIQYHMSRIRNWKLTGQLY